MYGNLGGAHVCGQLSHASSPALEPPAFALAQAPTDSPESLVTFLVEVLSNNDAPKKNAGLKTALKYSRF